jgi:hypothetical protein
MSFQFLNYFFWFRWIIHYELKINKKSAEEEIEKIEVMIKAKNPKAIYKFSSIIVLKNLFLRKIKNL